MNVLIAGCGYVGLRVANRLHTQGHAVYGLRRFPESSEPCIRWIEGDIAGRRISDSVPPIDTVILSAGLRSDTEKNYEALFVDGYTWLIDQLKSNSHPLSRIIMVSTTSVYAESDGGWVDESSPVIHVKSPAKYYLAAEKMIAQSGIPSVVLRMSGIYGPDRTRLIRAVKDGKASRDTSPHYLNHIHADDAAGAVAHVAGLDNPEPLYVASDRDPADRNDVLQWISDQLRLGKIPEARKEDVKTQRGGNKRCCSRKLAESGYSFRYPTYREGYANLLNS